MRFVPVRYKGTLTLAPFDATAQRFLRGLATDKPIEMEALHDRDMIEHRKIFGIINELATALHRDPERVRAELLYKTGNCHHLGELDGNVLISINSMSRHHMKDPELHAFWEEARQIILDEMLPEIADQAERDRLVHAIA